MTIRSNALDPYTRDRIRRRTGSALMDAAPTNGTLALTLGHRPETTSRMRTAARPNAIARYLEYILLLARGGADTSPYPLLALAEITALEGRMESMDKGATVRRYWQLKTEAADAQTRRAKAEAIAAETGDLEPLEKAEAEVAAVAQEAAATARTLRKHEIDPRDPEWRQS